VSGPTRALAAGRVARLVLVGVGALLGMVCAAAPAAAHDVLISSDPADGARLSRTPAAVVLTFDEPALAMGSGLVVTGPSGEVQVGSPQLVDNRVTQPLQGGAPAGSYVVDWRVTSADGHPVSGRLTFTSSAAGRGTPGAVTPGPAPAAPVPSSRSGGVWAAGAAVAVVLVAAGLARVRRRRRSAGEVVGGQPGA
jgi:methionine-rich copper-binding protein CopC